MGAFADSLKQTNPRAPALQGSGGMTPFGFVGNVLGDVGEFASGIRSLGGAVIGDVVDVGREIVTLGKAETTPRLWNIAKALPGAIAGDYSARYGGQGLGEVGHQLYENPLSYGLDLLGLGSIAGAGAKVAGRAAIAGTAGEQVAKQVARQTGSAGAGIGAGLDALMGAGRVAPLGLARRILPSLEPRMGPLGQVTQVAQAANPVTRALLQRPYRALTSRPVTAVETEAADLARTVAMLGDQAPHVLRNDLAAKLRQIAVARESGITRLDRPFVSEQVLKRATQTILGDLSSKWLRHREADIAAISNTLKPHMAADATFTERAHGVFQRLDFDPAEAAPAGGGGVAVRTALGRPISSLDQLSGLDEQTRALAERQLPEVLQRIETQVQALRRRMGGPEGLRFETGGDAVPDGFSGYIRALMGDEEVGRLNFGLDSPTHRYADPTRVSIEMVQVAERWRRQGVGEALIRRLQQEAPDKRLDWAYTTPDGQALRQSMELGERYLDSLYDPVRQRVRPGSLDSVAEAMEDMRLVVHELWTQPLIDRGVLTPAQALERSYRPLGLKLGRYDPKTGWDSPSAVAQIDDALRASGRSAPIYFPHMRPDDIPKLFDFFRSTRRIGAAKLAEAGYLKRNDLVLFARKNYVRDPMEVYIRRAARAVRHEETLDYLDTVASELGRPISSLDELSSAEVVFSPEFVRRAARTKTAIDDTIDDLISRGRDPENAMADAIRQATEGVQAEMAAAADAGAASTARMRLYAISKTVADQLEARFVPRLGVKTRLFWDGPMNLWRTWVLGASPRWVVNNTLGNTLFAKMQGARLRDVVGVMTGRYERLLRKMGPEGEAFLSTLGEARSGFARLEQQYVPRLGRAAEHPVGQFYRSLQAKPVVRAGHRFTEGMRRLNATIEDSFRQASFLRAAERQVAEANLRTSGRLFLRSEELLERLARTGMSDGAMGRALSEVNRFFGDYARLSPLERNVLRRFLVPFWSFYKHQGKLLVRFPIEMPFKAEVVRALGEVNAEMLEQFGPVPEWLEGAVPIGAGPEGISFLSMRGPDPFSASFEPPTSMLSPPIKIALEQSLGRNLFTGRQFTSEDIVYPFGSDDPWQIIRDDQGGVIDVQPAGKVTPGIGEHLLQQIPQYQALKQAIGGGRTYDTATLLDVLGGGGVQRDETGAPRYPTGPLEQLLRLSGITTYDYDVAGFQEQLEEQRQRALAEALSRFGGA